MERGPNIHIVEYDEIREIENEGIYYCFPELDKIYSSETEEFLDKKYVKQTIKQYISKHIFNINLQPLAGLKRGVIDIKKIFGEDCRHEGRKFTIRGIEDIYDQRINPVKMIDSDMVLWGVKVISDKFPDIRINEVVYILLLLNMYQEYLYEIKTELTTAGKHATNEIFEQKLEEMVRRGYIYNARADINFIHIQPILSRLKYSINSEDVGYLIEYFESLLGINAQFLLDQIEVLNKD